MDPDILCHNNREVECEFTTWPEPIQLWYQARSYGFDIFHQHAGIELHHCIEGNGYYWIDGVQYRMTPGLFTLIWAPQPHRVVAAAANYCRTVLQFPVDMLPAPFRSQAETQFRPLPSPARPTQQIVLSTSLHKEAGYLLRKIEQERREAKPYAAVAISILISEVMLLLFRAGQAAAQPDNPLSPHDEHLVRQAEELVGGWLTRPFTLGDLARELGLSAGHLCRVYRKVRNISLGAYIQQQRMLRACQLLGQGGRVTDIAYDCGYTDLSSFSKAFRRMNGASPKSFRQMPARSH